MCEPRHILITGASSGIGAALAEAYAGPGIRLALSGRDASRLEAVAAACRSKGATVAAEIRDVTDPEGMAGWITAREAAAPIDLVIANAGISAGTGGGGEGAAQARRIFAVNVDGVVNTVQPVIPFMAKRHCGQIAIVSSLASFRGFPGAPAYCASKAAVRVYGEGLRGSLAGLGISVSVICPGFVRSRMTEKNDFPMPLLMDAPRAAKLIVRGLARGRARIAFPRRLYLATLLFAMLPPGLTDGWLRRLPAKR
ncbi:MAG TPA: SDR family NAD(P)-dependent oxidoreductase [Alphaproteobacteria bacterium]|nr:SDR family NAD(P)-dependent oxidoreductase [Alphaproteobacteria bacterium]